MVQVGGAMQGCPWYRWEGQCKDAHGTGGRGNVRMPMVQVGGAM